VAYVEQNGIRTFRDGREVCVTPEAILARRREVWIRDERRCQCMKDCSTHKGRKCNRLLALTMKIAEETNTPLAHVHHGKRRGVSGSTRDDRAENLLTECGICHWGEEF
jgi:hypothetical protein